MKKQSEESKFLEMLEYEFTPYDRNSYLLTNPRTGDSYVVDVDPLCTSCPCADSLYRTNRKCKHVRFVKTVLTPVKDLREAVQLFERLKDQ